MSAEMALSLRDGNEEFCKLLRLHDQVEENIKHMEDNSLWNTWNRYIEYMKLMEDNSLSITSINFKIKIYTSGILTHTYPCHYIQTHFHKSKEMVVREEL